MGMLGVALVYVGFVLFMNGLMVLGKLSAKHVFPMNLFAGALIVAGAMRTVFVHGGEIITYFYAMQSLLFGFTYLWVGINALGNHEGKGLGWYCLLVCVVAVPTSFTAMPDIGLLILWLMWASLWFMFFLLLGLGKAIEKITGYWTIVNAIVTGIAGYTILVEIWPWQ